MKAHTRRIQLGGRLAAGGVLAMATLSLAACSSATKPQAQVPSVPVLVSASTSGSGGTSGSSGSPGSSGAAGQGGATTTATTARPRITLDMTNDQINVLYAQYDQCLERNGWNKRKNPRDQAAMTKAQNACVAEDPLPPWQFDSSNPKSGDFVHAVVQCLRDKGVQYVEADGVQGGSRESFSFGGPGNDPTSIRLGMQYTPDCEKQVAARGIGS